MTPRSTLFCLLFCIVTISIFLAPATAHADSIEDVSQSAFDLLKLQSKVLDLEKELQRRLENVENMEEDLVGRMSKIEENSVPLGFVYIQLPNQYSPDVIWPGVTWMEVTKEYEGLFFRAEGGGSEPFGSIQEDSTRQIIQVQSALDYDSTLIDVPKTGWSPGVPSGLFGGDGYISGLRFNTSDVEVRPKNAAIRIWKRIM